MRTGDIAAAAAIDRQSFSPAWSRESFRFEICESRVSHMVALERAAAHPPGDSGVLDKLRGRLNGANANANSDLLGYGCLWKIADEAHISNIAVRPDCRGRGYGEILLAGMIGKALLLEAGYIVLEVRVSNHVAQNLYEKYGFQHSRRLRRYYAGDGEDAWDMRMTLDHALRKRYERLRKRLHARQQFGDAFSGARHPRGAGGEASHNSRRSR